MSDLQIKVHNDTDEFQNIVIFQPEDELHLMFENNHLFPIAWQVFPLASKEEEVQRYGTTVYPSAQQIGVKYNLDNSDFIFEPTILNLFQGQLIIKIEAINGDKFAYSVDKKGGQHLDKLDGINENKSISCQNNFSSLVSIDFYKNNAKLATWKNVSNGDKANFKFKQKLYFMYDDSIKQGQIINKNIIDNNQNQIKTFNLTGSSYSLIEARLIYDPDETGKKKKWVIKAS
jgi:hypothetical protein